MDEARRLALADRVLARAGASSEVIVDDVSLGLTRFTQNAIHQNLTSSNTTVRVRALDGTRTGIGTTNDLSDAGLRAVAERARENARIAPPDDHVARLIASPAARTPQSAYDPATADASPELRARIAADVFAASERAGVWSAGYISTERFGRTIANALGTRSSFDGTTCTLNVKANAADSSGYAEYLGNALAGLDATHHAEIAVRKATSGAHPEAVEPGPWTVVLEPPAFAELLAYITDHFSAQSYDEGSSFLSEGLDRPYTGTNVTLASDYAHPLLNGIPFDGEGVPTQRPDLLARGIAKRLVTDSSWARRLGMPNTGHALPAPNAYGPQVRSLVVGGGEKPVEQLIAETDRGLLISRFWYIRPVDHRRTIVTGMTRDGTFLIEGGKVGRGVRNMRFNQSILGALSQCEFSSRQFRSGGYAYEMVVPAAKIENFTFSSVTDF